MMIWKIAKKEFLLNLPEEAGVREAIEQVIELGGPDSRALILSPDGNGLKVRAVVDGKPAVLETSLHDGAELSLMFAIGGGA